MEWKHCFWESESAMAAYIEITMPSFASRLDGMISSLKMSFFHYKKSQSQTPKSHALSSFVQQSMQCPVDFVVIGCILQACAHPNAHLS